MRCSCCQKPIQSVAVRLTQVASILNKTSSGFFEERGNLVEPTTELLCKDCFETFADCMNTMNSIAQETVSSTQIIEEVTFCEEI